MHLQVSVRVAENSEPVEVNEGYGAQVLVVLECLGHHLVKLVVVVNTDVVAQFDGALVSRDEIVVGTGDDGMLNQVSFRLVLLLDGVVLIGVGILGSVFIVLGLGLGTLVFEEFLQRLPCSVVEEVLFATGVDDDAECHESIGVLASSSE